MGIGARRILLALCAVAVAEVGGLAVVPSTVTSGDPGPYRGTPAGLVEAGRRLGIPARTLTRLQVRFGLPGGLHEPRAGFITAVYFHGHVFVAPGVDPTDALAYEYLHDVWVRDDPGTRARLTALLRRFGAVHATALEPELGQLVKADASNGADPAAARVDELHSIACSRTADTTLGPDLVSYCNFVLPGRRATTKVY